MTWKGDKGMLDMRRRPVFLAMEATGFTQLTLERFGFFPPFLANRPAARKVEGFSSGSRLSGRPFPSSFSAER